MINWERMREECRILCDVEYGGVQADMAREVGVSESVLNRFLRGKAVLSLENLAKICGAGGVSVEYFIDGREEPLIHDINGIEMPEYLWEILRFDPKLTGVQKGHLWSMMNSAYILSQCSNRSE